MAKKAKAEEVEDDNIDVEKMISKKYGTDIINPGTYIIQNPKKVLHISPNFDSECGGVPEGSLVTLSSPSGFGKTTLALTIVKSCQQAGKEVFYIDAENRLKPMNLEGIKGLDPSKLKVIRSSQDNKLTGEMYLQIATDLLKNRNGICLVIDSASSLCPASEDTNDVSGSIRSTSPRMFASFCRKNADFIGPNNNIVVIIKHVITNTSGYGVTQQEDGGEKLKFQTDIRLMCTKTPEKILEGDDVVGHILEWYVHKSAAGQSNVTFKTYIRYGIGIDEVSEIIEIAQDYGLIEKVGAWYYIDKDTDKQVKFQGVTKLSEYLTENEDAYKELLKKIQDMPK